VSEGVFESVAPCEDFKEGVPVSLRLSTGEQVCLVRVNGEVFGMVEDCPLCESPMSDGAIVEDYVIECSMHGTQFDVRDGSVVEQPGDIQLQTYEVEVRNDQVWVRPRE
jgi:nitrite reductase/ring-hydroxylating ferredoxin subunit